MPVDSCPNRVGDGHDAHGRAHGGRIRRRCADWRFIGSVAIHRAITSAGLSATLVTVLGLVIPHVVFVATGTVIFLRRSRDWPAMFFALALIVFTALRPLMAVERAMPAFRPAVEAVSPVALFFLFTFMFVFPTGHFVPSWTRFLMAGAVPAAVLVSAPMRMLMMAPDPPPTNALGSVRVAVIFLSVFMGVGLGAQIYRFRTTPDVVERQQIKLVGSAIGVLTVTLLLGFGIPALFVDTGNAWFAWGMLATVPLFLLVPVAVAVAVLRYQLFAIDHIISRTLAYTALTVVLAGVYTGTVVLLGPLAGGRSQVSVAAATLAAAAVFRPARRRLQGLVDRRFNRRRCDIRGTIEQFGGRLQDELDIAQVERELLAVVQDTLQPKAMSLWRASGAGSQGRMPRLQQVIRTYRH